MIEQAIYWIAGLVPFFKVFHISMLSLWCAGLFALPLMLARHAPDVSQLDYIRIRKATHYGYIYVITPAAVLTIVSGTALIFIREVFVTWMFAKLVMVALLVLLHVGIGYKLVAVSESFGRLKRQAAALPLTLLFVPILSILFLVLAKPELGEIPLPDWLLSPRGNQLPFDVPRR